MAGVEDTIIRDVYAFEVSYWSALGRKKTDKIYILDVSYLEALKRCIWICEHEVHRFGIYEIKQLK